MPSSIAQTADSRYRDWYRQFWSDVPPSRDGSCSIARTLGAVGDRLLGPDAWLPTNMDAPAARRQPHAPSPKPGAGAGPSGTGSICGCWNARPKMKGFIFRVPASGSVEPEMRITSFSSRLTHGESLGRAIFQFSFSVGPPQGGACCPLTEKWKEASAAPDRRVARMTRTIPFCPCCAGLRAGL